MEKYYLSIVVTTRNDNHGGDLLLRTQTFLNGLILQFNKYKIKSELIIVEWNPPADKPLLKDVLKINYENQYLDIRYVIVPAEIHNTFKYKETIPLYQMIAKNVGLRRAKGEFVICTNIDLLFSDGLMERLVKRDFQNNTFYRANRCDVPKEIMLLSNLEEQLEFGRNNILERHGRRKDLANVTTPMPNWVFTFTFLAVGLDSIIKIIKKKFLRREEFIMNKLDFAACGDFTMMSLEDWIKIDGYAEIDLYSLHVDSMALISAIALGIKQELFDVKEVTYHIYHKDGWTGFENPLEKIQFLLKRPSLDWYSIGGTGEFLIKERLNWNINAENWGYSNLEFEEHIISTEEE